MTWFAVLCRCADCNVHPSTDWFINEEGAAKAWNTRKPIEQILNELEEERKRAICFSHTDKGMGRAIKIVKEAAEEYRHRNHDLDIEASHSNDGWIPVSERLPSDQKEVLITLFDDDVYIGWFDFNDNCWSTNEFDCDDCDVTAWQPLPEPYKQKE